MAYFIKIRSKSF